MRSRTTAVILSLAGTEQVGGTVRAEQVVRTRAGATRTRRPPSSPSRNARLSTVPTLNFATPRAIAAVDRVGGEARAAVDDERHADAAVDRVEPVEVDGRGASLEHVDVAERDREAVDAGRLDERGGLVRVGEARARRVVARPEACRARPRPRRRARGRRGRARRRSSTSLEQSITALNPASAPRSACCERVRLVQEQRDGNARPLGGDAADGGRASRSRPRRASPGRRAGSRSRGSPARARPPPPRARPRASTPSQASK